MSSNLEQLGPRQRMYSRKSSTSSLKSSGSTKPSKKSTADSRSKQQRAKDKEARENLVIWKDPVWTLYYFIIETLELTTTYLHKFFTSRACLSTVAALTLSYYGGKHIPMLSGTFSRIEDKIYVCAYWVLLGVLSSVGLGTGLHTFLLYLGPFIAKVTMAAYECQSTDFPEPPFPEEVVCPDREAEGYQAMTITIFTIMSKVRLESFMWGAGTAIGELPPYFMARAARLAGLEPDDIDEDDDDEFKAEMKEALEDADTSTLLGKGKAFMHNLVNRVGFFGILLAASIPNPLFDLAGITCGHFLIPFWTFFGATLIGKAVVKMHIQMCFIIFLFSKHHIKNVIDLLSFAPAVQSPLEDFLAKQSAKFHNPGDGSEEESTSIVKKGFELFVVSMLGYFVVSIVNSLAQNQLKKRQNKNK